MEKSEDKRKYSTEYKDVAFGFVTIKTIGKCKAFILPSFRLKLNKMDIGNRFNCHLIDTSLHDIPLGIVEIKKRGTSKGVFIPLSISNKYDIKKDEVFDCVGLYRIKKLIGENNDEKIWVLMDKRDRIIYERFRKEEEELQHIADTISGDDFDNIPT